MTECLRILNLFIILSVSTETFESTIKELRITDLFIILRLVLLSWEGLC